MSQILTSLDLIQALTLAEERVQENPILSLPKVSSTLWQKYLHELHHWVRIDSHLTRQALDLTKIGNIGYSQSMVRPGLLGRLDVCACLTNGSLPASAEVLTICALTPKEVAESEEATHYRFLDEHAEKWAHFFGIAHLPFELQIPILRRSVYISPTER